VSTWSTRQFTEYFVAVNAAADEAAAVAGAVERAVEVVEAEVGVVVLGGRVRGAWGFGSAPPTVEQLDLPSGGGPLIVPGLGELHGIPNPLGSTMAGVLILGRLDDPFDPEERQMLQGMAQMLGAALRSIRALAAERTLRAHREREAAERLVLLKTARTQQRLVETLLTIQRAISNRRPLPEILDAVTGGAADLLDGAAVALVLAEGGHLAIASTSGTFSDEERPKVAAREAMTTGAAVIRPAAAGCARPGTVIAASVQVTGEMAGSLVAQLPGEADRHGEQRDQLAAFAQQVGLALTDARTVEAVHLAHHDHITGLPNRALFLTLFNRLLEAPGGAAPSVLFIDLDRFKAVNDSLGHEVGDQLLAGVAGRIRDCVRAGDTTARLGGDEFAVLLDDDDVDAVTATAERIITAIREPFRLAGRDVYVGASIGVALHGGTPAGSDDLLNKADVAMYRAKKTGPGKVVVYEPYMHTEALDLLGLRADLQRALEAGEFSLQYQPLVELDTLRPVGVEALVRWRSPTRGLVPPADFIPIAEESGLIVDIGQWVLATSARQAAAWRAEWPELTLNVNVSGHELVHPRFAENVMRALTVAGLPTHAVTLELTESVLMKDPVTAVAALSRLRDLGVQLSIDDFGTGYSSLAYLRELPVDELKIDRAFVARAELTSQDMALLCTIIELGHLLGLRVVAEGVETEAQLQALRGLGCRLGQGYHLQFPADVPPFLDASRLTRQG
jgi:diguanylate cyclase (GGDEF)-like protein